MTQITPDPIVDEIIVKVIRRHPNWTHPVYRVILKYPDGSIKVLRELIHTATSVLSWVESILDGAESK